MGEAAAAHLRASRTGERSLEERTGNGSPSHLERDLQVFHRRAAQACPSAARAAQALARRLAIDRHLGGKVQAILQSPDAHAYQSDVWPRAQAARRSGRNTQCARNTDQGRAATSSTYVA